MSKNSSFPGNMAYTSNGVLGKSASLKILEKIQVKRDLK